MKLFSCNTLESLRDRLGRLYGDKHSLSLLQRLTVTAGRCTADEIPSPRPGSAWSQQDVLLITYGDMVRNADEAGLVTLKRFVDDELCGAINCIHLLPIFPYSSDEGFSVIDYRKIDPQLGDWSNVDEFGRGYRLMLDLVINHCSRKSEWFQDFIDGIAPGRGYFLTASPDADLSTVVRPRTHPLLTPVLTRHGERHVWTTFSEDQVDLDFSNPDVLFEFLDLLLLYASHGTQIIRLDAIAFLWKKQGSSCLHLPETHEVVKLLRDLLTLVAPDVLLMTETNVPHEENISYFGDGDEAQLVYQFSLPPLLLHALQTGNARYLTRWAAELAPPPEGCTFLNFTASHDGIGVRPLEGLIPDEELDGLIDAVELRGGLVSRRSLPDGSQRAYELNITWFDALSGKVTLAGRTVGEMHIARFLCSQTIPLALQGIPAIYFHSLTATRNDRIAADASGHARDINRRRWTERELRRLLKDSESHTSRVFWEYLRLVRLRIVQPAFHPDAAQQVLSLGDAVFAVQRTPLVGAAAITAISNLSEEPQRIELDGAGALTDLIAGVEYHTGAIELAPYQSVWLTPSEPRAS